MKELMILGMGWVVVAGIAAVVWRDSVAKAKSLSTQATNASDDSRTRKKTRTFKFTAQNQILH